MNRLNLRNAAIPRNLIFAAVAVLVVATAAAATEPNTGWTVSYDQAISESQQTNKPVMLLFTGSDWCIYCKKLEAEVFATEQFSNWSSGKFVKVEVDFPQGSVLPHSISQQNEQLKQRYAGMVTSYPTVLFVDANGNTIAKTGYMPGGASNWMQQVDELLSDVANVNPQGSSTAIRNSENETSAVPKIEPVAYGVVVSDGEVEAKRSEPAIGVYVTNDSICQRK